MKHDPALGRIVVATVLTATVAMSITIITVYLLKMGMDGWPQRAVRLALTIFLCWRTYERGPIARWILVALLVIGGTSTLMNGLEGGFRLLLVQLGVFYLIAATLLTTGPGVRAYFRREPASAHQEEPA